MKTVKSIGRVGHFFNRGVYSTIFCNTAFPISAHGVIFLLSIVFMAAVAYTFTDQFFSAYAGDLTQRMTNIEGQELSMLVRRLTEYNLYFDAVSVSSKQWPPVFAVDYNFIRYGALILLVSTGLVALISAYKSILFFLDKYFSLMGCFRKAINNNELSVRYQPIADMQNGSWRGAEALLRWNKNGCAISPSVFIPQVEKSDLMTNTTRWVCRQVVEDYSRLFWACDEFYISVNLSAEDVLDATFPDFIEDLLSDYHLSSVRFVFEVTERVFVDARRASVQLSRLRAKGHRIALDDFGTGYSCLAYLASLPLDIIKIDRAFMTQENSQSANIVLPHLLDLARDMKLEVIVEGVESLSEVKWLQGLGVTTAQGWFYAKELSAEELIKGYFSQSCLEINRAI